MEVINFNLEGLLFGWGTTALLNGLLGKIILRRTHFLKVWGQVSGYLIVGGWLVGEIIGSQELGITFLSQGPSIGEVDLLG